MIKLKVCRMYSIIWGLLWHALFGTNITWPESTALTTIAADHYALKKSKFAEFSDFRHLALKFQMWYIDDYTIYEADSWICGRYDLIPLLCTFELRLAYLILIESDAILPNVSHRNLPRKKMGFCIALILMS